MPGSRKDTTVAERLEIVKKLQNGVSVSALANEYGLTKRSIYKYRTNAVHIQQFALTNNSRKMKRNRTSPVEEINIRLNTWILKKRASGEIIPDNLIRRKALELHREIGIPKKFNASHGWLWRFKRRYNYVDLVDAHHDEQDDADKIADRFVEELARKIKQEDIDANNIYNMGESSLWWKYFPQKEIKEPVGIGFCANSTGTHKLPLLFIHQCAYPRELKHIKNNLSVVFKHQKNARIDEEVFNNWYTNHFQPTVRQRQLQDNNAGKVLLLVDNFKDHNVRDRKSKQFEVMFLPPNTTSILQPMSQGVIRKCKTYFRYHLFQKIYECVGIQEFYLNYDVKDCIDLIHNAWESVSQTDIYNTWQKLLKRQKIEEEEETEIDEEINGDCELGDVNYWISRCEEAEFICNKNNEETEETTSRHCKTIEELFDQLDDLFDKLNLWAEMQPEYIQSHAKILIDYHYKNNVV